MRQIEAEIATMEVESNAFAFIAVSNAPAKSPMTMYLIKLAACWKTPATNLAEADFDAVKIPGSHSKCYD